MIRADKALLGSDTMFKELVMRKIAKHSPVRPTRMFWSEKNQTLFFMESKLEREFALRCEFDPEVISYHCQPKPLEYKLPGETRKRRYTPDTIMRHSVFGVVVIEVKFKEDAEKPAIKSKHEHLKRLYAKKGASFIVLTEEEIRDEDLTKNLSNLYKFRRFPIEKKALKKLKKLFPKGGLLGEIIPFTGDDMWLSVLYQAIAHGYAKASLTRSLSPLTEWDWATEITSRNVGLSCSKSNSWKRCM
ncbi:TnsA endonuclease N-terminal domain-containing protein [Neptuniibacter sp. QD37_6]|uniref:TnsA endonuclease N-terminal domain-containing protein n=1 Tax=Neptuniibacter sp. QD37_6 TaxID=3398210 RepID=UPI0039F51213